MRTAPNDHIWNLWNSGGPFIGDNGATHGRVTVEIGWVLRASASNSIGGNDKGPFRWFQRSNNSQTETEVQNVKTIDIDRTIDVDSATCRIVLTNQRMKDNTTAPETGTRGESVGNPGFYWTGRGDSAASADLWGWTTNQWNGVLQPNALIRTYQGFGGRGLTIDQALAAGNILLTGVWLVDAVDMDAASGLLTITCRDMAKLLIEQMLYPPITPIGTNQSVHYPLHYYKWVFVNHPVVPYGSTIYKTGFTPTEGKLTAVSASSHYDHNGVIHPGRDAADAADDTDGRDPDTYWLSAGSADSHAVETIMWHTNGATIEGVNIQPFGGNNRVQIIIDGTHVITRGVGWERAATIDLAHTYTNTSTIQLVFDHLGKLGPQPNPYRAGVRDFQIGTFTNTVTGGGRIITGIHRGSNDTPNGYWLSGTDGAVFTFGHLKFYGSEGNKVLNGQIVGMASNPATGKGYRLVGKDGGVFDFGDLYYHGSLPGLGITVNNVVGIENGDQGHTGYYVIRDTGQVYSFGTAVYHGNHSGGSVVGMSVKQTVPTGYWTVNLAGQVQAHGGATSHGSVSGINGFATAIESTSTGNGYWIVAASGAVYSFGDAVYHGGVSGLSLGGGITDMVRTPSDNGYWLVGDDGGVFAFGDAPFYGSLPEQFARVGDGNYNDYSDIVRDILLWCGWWFRNPANPTGTAPHVFGNIDDTGIYSPDNLTEDFFDKKPAIDVINTLKEVVGYINYADEIGAYHFHTPNIWTAGNFLDTGPPTSRMAVIDEQKQIVSYNVNFNDTDARSTITIATEDPALNIADTKSTSITSQWAGPVLRGLERPALWVNGKFLTGAIQTTMAHLIDLHLFMQSRQGSLRMVANPIIQIDDQVQIYERSTSETYIHYVRGYTTHMDLDTGEFTQTLQTHWMGDGSSWAISYTPVDPVDLGGTDTSNSNNVDAAPVFTAASPTNGSVQVLYGYQFQATGSPFPVFSITSGTLPPGMALGLTGILVGNPTTAGTYTFSVQASNGVGTAANTGNVTVVIAPTNNVAPAFQNAVPPNGTVNSSYSFTFTATGVPSPTFSVVSGSLPTGLSLNSTTGALTGTPTTAATFTFSVRATNSSGADNRSCTVIISAVGGNSSGFLSGTSSGIINLSGQSNVVISGKRFQNINDVAIQLLNCTGVYIHDCDFDGNVGDIFLQGCTGQLRIENCRARNTGDNSTGSGHSNFIQFNTSFDNGTGGIRGNIVYGGKTEDMISMYQSGGTDASHTLVIENNHFQSPLPPDGMAWDSNSGTGILVGDVSGPFITVRNNTFLDVGQVGIGVNHATNAIVTNNIVYGHQRVGSNVGIYTPYSGSPYVGNNEVSHNRVWWIQENGSANAYYGGSNTGGTVINLGTNTFQDATINPADLQINPTTMVFGGGSSPPPSGGYFSVLPVGASLPGGMTAAGADAAAAAAVNHSTWEPRTDNNTANHTIVSQPNTLANFSGDLDGTWNSTYKPRISGNFQGTTDEIIQWAAYKWGWSDEYIRAEAIAESNWHQSGLGDYEPASNGHRVYDRSDDPSPTSFSIIQVRWYYHPNGVLSNNAGSSYPGIHVSTAFALDLFCAMLRGIYDGHSTFLNGGGMAAAGDAWGAIGSWFAGAWHTSAANGYITTVQNHLANKPWLNQGF